VCSTVAFDHHVWMSPGVPRRGAVGSASIGDDPLARRDYLASESPRSRLDRVTGPYRRAEFPVDMGQSLIFFLLRKR